MQHNISLFFIASFCLFLFSTCKSSSIRSTGKAKLHSEKEWAIIWEDDFSVDGHPDSSKWIFSGRGTSNWKCYCSDSESTTFVKDGNLYLKGIISTDSNDTAKYETGCIESRNKFSFLYGKIEVKAKVNGGKGAWPAIWMMPSQPTYGGWPNSGEIDIMERLNQDNYVYQSVHSQYIDVQDIKNPKHSAKAVIESGDYNVYGLEWNPDRLDFFVNGKPSFSYPRLQNTDSNQWPFDREFYIILNQALGGDWVGEILDEDLPVEMLVDWVRVYQKK